MTYPVSSGKDSLSKFVALGVSAFSPNPDRLGAYSLIETEILNLEESISQIGDLLRQWKTHHNDLSITARLPDELLHHVFGFLDMDSPQWIQVTHVCSRWRNAALGFPRLWRRPFFHNLDCGNEMKRRAKATPLIIEINRGMSDLPTHQYHDILSNITHAEELVLCDNNGTHVVHEGSRRLRLTEFPELKLPAPFLKRVALTSTPFGEDYLLPSDISIENAPNLHYLELKNWNLPWTSSLDSFLGLTELHISFNGSHGAHNHRFPLSCVASTLIRFQSLRNLSIDDIFHDISPADSQWFSLNRDLIKFPALQKLNFRSKMEVRELFFSRFDWTNATFVWIKGCWNGSEIHEPVVLASTRTFLRTLGHRLPYPVRYLSMWEGDSDDYINLSISHRSASFDLPNPETIRIELPPLPDLASDLIQVFHLQDLERFNYLQSKSYGPLREDIWASLGRCIKLRWIQVAYNQPGLLKLFATKVIVKDKHSSSEPSSWLGPDDSTSERSWLFPALKILYIDRWVFWKPDSEENFGIIGPSWIVPDNNIEYDELRSVLESRKENGCQLELINFWHCKGISRVDLADLHDVCSKAAFWKDEEPE